MIEIDGSYGEGGGQILRTALSLSCLLKRPFRIFNIRKGRKKPGLMPQHLTSIRAAQILSIADVKGDHAGSTELLFSPRTVKSGDFFFDIGTAGSTSLVLQTLIPALLSTEEKNTVVLKGGTHVPFSPSFHYLEKVFVPILSRLRINIQLTIESYGYYPRGGGKVRAEIIPVKEVKPLKNIERGIVKQLKGLSGVGNLPLSIAERQKHGLMEKIKSEMKDIPYPVEIELLNVSTPGQGTFIFLESESEHSVAGFTSLGERGKRAETVGEEAAKEFLDYYNSGAAFDQHLSDQIVLYLSMCNKESEFTTSCITHHLLTNLWAISLFREFHYSAEGEIGKPGKIKINSLL
ncbi:MAG: RNA 3'-terminal phosphate cyclase [Nitrospirota bacterium]|nr:RNA 3'-terminal phosphate cyclase [Nitrospirota bacterium]